jgi:hypothetical protein
MDIGVRPQLKNGLSQAPTILPGSERRRPTESAGLVKIVPNPPAAPRLHPEVVADAKRAELHGPNTS